MPEVPECGVDSDCQIRQDAFEVKISDTPRLSNFAIEEALAPPLQLWLAAQGLLVRREVPTPVGTADLVACAFRSKRIQDRLALGQRRRLGSPLRCHIWHQIPDLDSGDSITFAQLRHRYEHLVDSDRVWAELERLVKDHFVRISDTGHVQKVNGWHPLHDRLIAIEMKLTRLDEASAQAANYRAFADEAYVAAPLPALLSWLARGGRTILRERGVGALGVTSSQVRLLVAHGRRADHASTEYMRTNVVERFWDTVKGNSASTGAMAPQAAVHGRSRPGSP